MLTLAVRFPVTGGVKVTLIAQLAPAAMFAELAGHVLFWLKSPLFVPVMAIVEIVSGALPVFVSVMI
jgi:hypothetical protein